MPKVLPSSPPLNYFSSHFNSGGSDANSVGERLDSVCVSPQKSGLQKHSYLNRIGLVPAILMSQTLAVQATIKRFYRPLKTHLNVYLLVTHAPFHRCIRDHLNSMGLIFNFSIKVALSLI